MCSLETAMQIDLELGMEDAVALALLITAVTEKALKLCQVEQNNFSTLEFIF
jgi:hypothetical protein